MADHSTSSAMAVDPVGSGQIFSWVAELTGIHIDLVTKHKPFTSLVIKNSAFIIYYHTSCEKVISGQQEHAFVYSLSCLVSVFVCEIGLGTYLFFVFLHNLLCWTSVVKYVKS